MEFLGRWFTPSNSDASGMVGDKNNAFKWPTQKPEKKRVRERRARTESVYSGSALGSSDEAQVAKKQLLGE
jgi:hypothetical protein